MAMSPASRHIFELHQQWQNQRSAALEKPLLAAIDELLAHELSKRAASTGTTPAQLRAQLLESLDGDSLQLCAGLSEDWTIRDAIKAEMAALALPEESLSTRASENARLALLLREYRASGKNAKEAEALTQALHPKMLNIAANLALCYGLPLESSDEAVQELFTKWLKQGGILVGWSESGGASVTTWIYRALQNTLRNLRDKEHNHQKWLQADIDEETEKRETDLIHRQPDVRAKSQSFLVYLDQRSKRLCQFADEMVGNTVQITDANGQTKMTQLTEHHRATFMKLLELAEHGDLTDHALGKALRESKATAGRWKLAVFTYIQTHPQREEIKEWIKPVWISVLKES